MTYPVVGAAFGRFKAGAAEAAAIPTTVSELLNGISAANFKSALEDGRTAALVAAAVQRPGQVVRYCRDDATGAGDGTANNAGGAWTLAQCNAAMATTPNMYVVVTGTFAPTASNYTGNLFLVQQDGITLDLATGSGVVKAWSPPAWTGPDANGEYYITLTGTQLSECRIRVTEDGLLMDGVSATDCPSARNTITAVAGNYITLKSDAYRRFEDGDSIAFVSADAGGLTRGTRYYIRDISWSGNSPTFRVALTAGGTAVTVTSDLVGKFMWSLADGRKGDPVPGSLNAGEFSYAPWLGRLYIKPTDGTVEDHTYTFQQSGAANGIKLQKAASGETISDVDVIGGTVYGFVNRGISVGNGVGFKAQDCRVIGTVVKAVLDGIITDNAQDCEVLYCEVVDSVFHAIGSKGLQTTEPGCLYAYNVVREMGHNWASGDTGDIQAYVTNPLSVGVVFFQNFAQNIGKPRDMTTYPHALGKTCSPVCFVSDDSGDIYRVGNYIDGFAGWAMDCTNSNPKTATNAANSFANVIDGRNNTAYDPADGYTIANHVFRVSMGSNATGGGDYDTTDNLIILGPMTTPTGGDWDSAVWSYRYALTAATYNMDCYARDNIIIVDNQDAEWSIYARRRTTAAQDAKMRLDSDRNTVINASANIVGVKQFNSTTGQTLTASLTLAETVDGWTAMSGIACDANSSSIAIGAAAQSRVNTWKANFWSNDQLVARMAALGVTVPAIGSI